MRWKEVLPLSQSDRAMCGLPEYQGEQRRTLPRNGKAYRRENIFREGGAGV